MQKKGGRTSVSSRVVRSIAYAACAAIVGAPVYVAVFLWHCGYGGLDALAIVGRDPTVANWKYYFIPKGTSESALVGRLGKPDQVITTPVELRKVCREMAHAGYAMPKRTATGKVLYYAVAGGFIESYQIFYYFDDRSKLEATFVGGKRTPLLDTT